MKIKVHFTGLIQRGIGRVIFILYLYPMFCGIIETTGVINSLKQEASNLHFEISASFVQELKVDQSVAHNGVCLTVTAVNSETYFVTAIDETLKKTNLGTLQVGDEINLERCLQYNGRVDGHLVQGHIDQTAKCAAIKNDPEGSGGSWIFTFEYDSSTGNLTVEKGSVCVNGVSLTVVNSLPGKFSVAIIPYTYQHTIFHNLKVGEKVNLEFDIIGKYVKAYLKI